MSLRVLIVDDEPLARRVVRGLLAGREGVTIIGECGDGRHAITAIRAERPDLVFLDVQMPECDGFAVLAALESWERPAVVFTTAYDEFAVRAFEVHALDYLVKPFTDARFDEAFRHARARIGTGRDPDALTRELAALLATLGGRGGARTGAADAVASSWRTRILVPAGARTVVVPVDEITCIRADDYYAAISWRGKSWLLREPLADLERSLDPRAFVRVHRSAIVRLGAVVELRSAARGSTVAVLEDGTRVPVSRSRRDALTCALGERATGPSPWPTSHGA